jgi:hypothetical protein
MIGRERCLIRVQCTMRAVNHLLWMRARVNFEPKPWAVLEVLAGRLERQA